MGLWLALAVSASGAEIKIGFSDFAAGQTPTNFHNALAGTGRPGGWKIVTDESPSAFAPLMPQITPTAPAVRRPVLAQLSQDPADERFPMFIYDGLTFKNFKLATQFKIVSGVAEQMAGVVFRFQNTSNFYVLRASALGRNLRFYKVVDGVRSAPIGPALDIATNTWHTLAVQCLGDQITCWLDGKPAMPTMNDSSFSSGKIGFWTKSDAVSCFGDTTVDYTPMVPAAQALVNSIMKKYPRIVGLRIYAPDDKGRIRILASRDETEIGQPGTDAET
ncbi:MAG: family 16 glycoside hydrolase, partial [Verrucomicrobiota bacterium]